MCGIVGIYNYNKLTANASDLIQKMTSQIRHRGPDATGAYIDKNIAFGHARLSIIDLSENGNQPLFNEDDTICMVFNGEIYNYKQLRLNLIERGHKFKSNSDGEVILHLYEDHSFECLKYIDGMFAFAIYDKKLKKLFLARDRVGEKPLYYMWHNENFYFASEVKSFKCIPGYTPEISAEGIISYFSNTQVPAPYSMYKDIYKLIPGHFAIIDQNELRVSKYWSVDYTHKLSLNTQEEFVEQLEQKFHQAIMETMLSDVPLGVTLSGGLDSSMVLAMMNRVQNDKFKTFTLGEIAANKHDAEIERAMIVSEKFKTEHAVLGFSDLSFEDCEHVVSTFCEPVGIFDIFHMYYLKKHMKGHVKVVLSGNGADEVFAGYSSYSKVLERAESLHNYGASADERNIFLNELITQDYKSDMQANSDMLFADDLHEISSAFDPLGFLKYYYDMSRYDNFLDGRLFIDLMIAVNHSAGLMDTIGMAHSIEVRSPFLHRNIIEFAASLPLDLKINSNKGIMCSKYILKLLASKYLPENLVFIDKFTCGQFIDYKRMLRTTWRKQVADLFFDYGEVLSRYFCSKKLHALWNKFLSNSTSAYEDQNLRKIFIFLLWHKNQTDTCLAQVS